jgi:uncharacterized membrane protein YagU involved in acid resistance
MKDKFIAGLIAGFLAGIVSIGFELLLVGLFHFGQPSFLRFSGMMLFTHAPQGLLEQLVATFVHLLFSAYMGSLFAYFLVLVSECYDVVKGAVWGLFITWIIWAVTFLFNLRPENSSPTNAIENDLSAIIYGVALALLYRFIHNRSVTSRSRS